MPSLKTFAAVFTDVSRLIAAVEANAEQLPDLENAKAPLVATWARLQDLALRRDTLNADKQTLTKQLREVVEEARDRSTELRGFVVSKLGRRSEKLVEFKVQPRRKGARRTKAAKAPVSTPPPAPAPQPVPGTTPTVTA